MGDRKEYKKEGNSQSILDLIIVDTSQERLHVSIWDKHSFTQGLRNGEILYLINVKIFQNFDKRKLVSKFDSEVLIDSCLKSDHPLLQTNASKHINQFAKQNPLYLNEMQLYLLQSKMGANNFSSSGT